MAFNEANKQIQCYPTPEIFVFVKRGPRFVNDLGIGRIGLTSILQLVPHTLNVPLDNAKGSIGLTSVVVAGAETRSVSDNGKGSIGLTSIQNIVPVTRSPVDNAKGNIGLTSILQLTPVTRSVADNAKGSIGLTSIVA